MNWTVLLHEDFDKDFKSWPGQLRKQFDKVAGMLGQAGPQLSRPHVDHLKASRHSNMKELRFAANDGCWRVAFAFNHRREAVILAAGDKAGQNQKRFYKNLIREADQRFDEHLDDCKTKRKPRCVALTIS